LSRVKICDHIIPQFAFHKRKVTKFNDVNTAGKCTAVMPTRRRCWR